MRIKEAAIGVVVVVAAAAIYVYRRAHKPPIKLRKITAEDFPLNDRFDGPTGGLRYPATNDNPPGGPLSQAEMDKLPPVPVGKEGDEMIAQMIISGMFRQKPLIPQDTFEERAEY